MIVTHKIYTKQKFWLFAAPLLLFYKAFIIYPLIMCLVYSFTGYRGIGALEWNNFANYTRLIHDRYFWLSVRNSLICAVSLFLFVIPLSFLYALWLNKQRKRNTVYKVIIFASYVIPGVLCGLLWSFILKPNNGLINSLLALIGVKGPAWIGANGILSPISFSMVCAWSSMGFYMSLWQAGLKSIPADVLEASSLDGCTGTSQIFRIILPMLRENVTSICIFVLTAALKIYEVVYILTGGGPAHASETIVSYLYTTTFDGMLYGYGMTIAVAEFVFAALISLLSMRLSRRNAD